MSTPLADRLRPANLDEVVGHDRWLGDDGPLRKALADGAPYSLVLWGPPGCGKTTVARALASSTNLVFVQISAVLDGVKQLRAIVDINGHESMRPASEVMEWTLDNGVTNWESVVMRGRAEFRGWFAACADCMVAA